MHICGLPRREPIEPIPVSAPFNPSPSAFFSDRIINIGVSSQHVSPSRASPGKKFACNAFLVILSPIILILDLVQAVKIKIVGRNEAEAIRDHLRGLVSEGNQENTLLYLYREISPRIRRMHLGSHPLHSWHFLVDLLSARELHPHLHELLKGANIKIRNDHGLFYERWRRIHGAYHRPSSHRHERGRSWGLAGQLVCDFHFWIDSTGATRFQIENHPLSGRFGGIFNKIRHACDFLRYCRDGLQQGVCGTSLHTEDNCIEIEIDAYEFQQQRFNLIG